MNNLKKPKQFKTKSISAAQPLFTCSKAPANKSVDRSIYNTVCTSSRFSACATLSSCCFMNAASICATSFRSSNSAINRPLYSASNNEASSTFEQRRRRRRRKEEERVATGKDNWIKRLIY